MREKKLRWVVWELVRKAGMALSVALGLWGVIALGHAEASAKLVQLSVSHRQEPAFLALTATPSSMVLPDPATLHILADAPSSVVQTNPIVIGYSVAGRPLEVFRFGSGTRHRRMIVAGIHGGNEWNSIALADELIAFLGQNQQRIPADTTLYILRALNPDGEARSHHVDGRVNENGVDLNRNWPLGWRRVWPDYGCWVYRPVSAGWRPASEPETMALMAFILSERVEALISYHSAALGIFPGGWPPDPASVSLAEAVAAVVDYPYPPQDTGCLYTGTLSDWAAANGIPALDIELSDHVHTDFDRNVPVLEVFLDWGR